MDAHLPLQSLISGAGDFAGVVVVEHLALDDECIALAHEVAITDNAVAVMASQERDLLAVEFKAVEVDGDVVAVVGQHPARVGDTTHLAPLING